jgi:hypothetical protein
VNCLSAITWSSSPASSRRARRRGAWGEQTIERGERGAHAVVGEARMPEDRDVPRPGPARIKVDDGVRQPLDHAIGPCVRNPKRAENQDPQ